MIALPVAHHIATAIPFFVPAMVLPTALGVIAFRDRRRLRREARGGAEAARAASGRGAAGRSS